MWDLEYIEWLEEENKKANSKILELERKLKELFNFIEDINEGNKNEHIK